MKLYEKYRPKKLEDVVGNEEQIESLQKEIDKNGVPQVMLLHGPTGTGKTTIARILANTLDATNNLTELDSAQFNGVDTIREIRRNSRLKPIGSKHKVYIMDEIHNLTRNAQEAFLKELETTPNHVYYFLCTTNPEKLIAPLKGRCMIYEMQTLESSDMRSLLKRVCKKEKEKVDSKVIQAIAKSSNGHPRNALNILQQVLPVSPKKRLAIAKKVESIENDSIELCRNMLQLRGWNEAQEILKGLKKEDAESIRRSVLGYCQSVLLGKDYKGSHIRAAQILSEFEEPTYDMGFTKIVYACYSFYSAE